MAMAVSLFITGASGFVGRHLVARCDPSRSEVACLSRQPVPGDRKDVRWLQGDLLDPASYRAVLGPETTVIHLAAVTGKAAPDAYARVNVEGTRTLLNECAKQGVRRFVLVSSVAARYADLKSYPYGASKRAAEQLVEAGGVPYQIIRPTVVLGSESPIWQKLRQLGRARVIPLIGGGVALTQPIHVRDVAAALLAAARVNNGTGISELGGPEQISMRDLLARIHGLFSRSRPVMIGIPYGPVRGVLRALEPRFSNLLPVTAGQLSLFVNDSTVHSDGRWQAMVPAMMGIDEMIRASEFEDA